jgi:hypothetical protein
MYVFYKESHQQDKIETVDFSLSNKELSKRFQGLRDQKIAL